MKITEIIGKLRNTGMFLEIEERAPIQDAIKELEKFEELRKIVASMNNQDASWPSHDNVPLAIAAAVFLDHNENKKLRDLLELAYVLLRSVPPEKFNLNDEDGRNADRIIEQVRKGLSI